MNNPQNVTIVVLMISAAVLGGILVGSFTGTTQPAYGGTLSAGGDYVAVTGSYNQYLSILYVVDVVANKLNVYVPNQKTSTVELRDTVNLAQVFR